MYIVYDIGDSMVMLWIVKWSPVVEMYHVLMAWAILSVSSHLIDTIQNTNCKIAEPTVAELSDPSSLLSVYFSLVGMTMEDRMEGEGSWVECAL